MQLRALVSAIHDWNWWEAEMDSILSLCIPVYPPSSRWASFSSFMSTYYLSSCHPCRCTVTSSPLQFAKVTAFHGPFSILQKMYILFREGLGSQQNWVEVQRCSRYPLLPLMHILPLFPYMFSPSSTIVEELISESVPWGYSQCSHSKHHIQRCAHAQLSFWKFVNNFIFEHVLCKVWQDNGAWPRCLKPWLTCASAFFGEVLGCTLLGPAQWWLLSSRPLSPLGMSVGRVKVKHRHPKC